MKLKFLFSLLFLVFTADISAQERLLKYISKDSINDQPKITAWAGANMKMNGYYNIKGGLQDFETFSIGSIDINSNDNRQNLGVDLYQTQVRMEGSYIHPKAGKITAHIEWDFWGGNGAMRLRKAYVKTDHWQIGQDWESFGNQEIWANVLDFDGPPSGVWARIPFIKYFNSFGKSNWHYEIALQTPTVDYNEFPEFTTSIETDYQNVPDLVLASSYREDWGHLRLSTIYRKINFLENGIRNSLFGYGATISGMWGNFGESNLQFLAVAGKGITTYLVTYVGNGYDAYPQEQNIFTPTPAIGGWTSYEHYFTHRIHSNIVYGFTMIDVDDISLYYVQDNGGTDIKVIDGSVNLLYNYILLNLMYDPYPNLTLGVELNYGIKRVIANGYYLDQNLLPHTPTYMDRNKNREAMRISFGFMYNF
ncbi:MAG: DcaP family trimeric outer membrane transporter [Bacteroidota bacterium]